MNVVEIQKEIERISPAAGRQSALLLTEISRLESLVASQNRTLLERQEENAALSENLKLQTEQIEDDAEAILKLTDRILQTERQNLQLREQTEKQAEQLERSGPDEGQQRDFLWRLSTALRGNLAARLRDVSLEALRDRVLEEAENLRQEVAKSWRAQGHTKSQLLNTWAHVTFTLAKLADHNAPGEKINPTTPDEFMNEFVALVEQLSERIRSNGFQMLSTNCIELSRTLGGPTVRPDDMNTDISWWEHMLVQVRGIRERGGAAEEALQNALNQNRELQQSLNELKPNEGGSSPFDVASHEIKLSQLSSALNATHSALLEMQGEYAKQRSKASSRHRDLRKALADIEFWKGVYADSEKRLHLVDMVLRGQEVSIVASAPYGSATLDAARGVMVSYAEVRATAERELNWRQQVEVQRDEEHKRADWAQNEMGRMKKFIETLQQELRERSAVDEEKPTQADEQGRWNAAHFVKSESTALDPDKEALVSRFPGLHENTAVRETPGDDTWTPIINNWPGVQ